MGGGSRKGDWESKSSKSGGWKGDGKWWPLGLWEDGPSPGTPKRIKVAVGSLEGTYAFQMAKRLNFWGLQITYLVGNIWSLNFYFMVRNGWGSNKQRGVFVVFLCWLSVGTKDRTKHPALKAITCDLFVTGGFVLCGANLPWDSNQWLSKNHKRK